MSKFDPMFQNVKNSDDYRSNGRAMQYFISYLQHAKSVPEADREQLKSFALGEMKRLIEEIPKAESYLVKDAMFFYEDALLGVYMLSAGGFENASATDKIVISKLVETVDDNRKLEGAVDNLFKLQEIDENLAGQVVGIAKSVTDGYERAMFYRALLDNKKDFSKFTEGAKSVIAEYMADDIEGILPHGEFSDDDRISLEYSADACAYFMTDRLCTVLNKVLETHLNRVRYYAIVSLLENGKPVSAEVIRQMAEDTGYAYWVYGALGKHGKLDLYPEEYASAEYLATSDMIQWLMYPTELGKKPDKIELLGVTKKKKETYFIFRYMSDSDCLSDDLKNKWLIGWASDGGGTFSNFDLLSDYEKKNEAKTVKYIAKKLL